MRIAVDAIKSSSSSHHFLSVTKQGISAIVETTGNDLCHIILRGSNTGPNYSSEHVAGAKASLEKAGLPARIMIDCSHGNSEKKHENQIKVVENIAEQLSAADSNSWSIIGVMLESNLVEGRQNVPPEGPQNLNYGQSITDACIDWDMTVQALDKLRAGVQQRRQKTPENLRPTTQVNRDLLTPQNKQEGFNDAALATLGK